MSSARAKGLTRKEALAAKPERLPAIAREEMPDGELKVTVRLERPGWQRMLGAPREFERTFQLDAYGRKIYEACDGRTRVDRMTRDFARRHRLAPPEAEMSVTAYLKTLVGKGLVAIKVSGGRGK